MSRIQKVELHELGRILNGEDVRYVGSTGNVNELLLRMMYQQE